MRVGKRLLAGASLSVALVAVTTFASLAIGQPRPRPPITAAPPRPRPPAVVDAGAAPVDPYAAGGDAGAAPATTATPPIEPPVRMESYDGGVKPSPLSPMPNEFPDGGAPAQSLDYDRLLADIASLRARVAAVSDNLFKSRLAVAIETSGDHGKIGKLTVSLDDGIVYTAPANFRADDLTRVYEHAVAPGRHAVTVEVERSDDRELSFRSAQRSRFIVDVPREHELTLDVRIWDDSTMGDFPGDHSGRYDLRIRAKANAKKR